MARDGELVLGVLDLLLDAPTVALDLAALQATELGPGLLELGGRAAGVDLAQVNRVVDENERPVRVNLEEARPGCQLDHHSAGEVNANRARLQRRRFFKAVQIPPA